VRVRIELRLMRAKETGFCLIEVPSRKSTGISGLYLFMLRRPEKGKLSLRQSEANAICGSLRKASHFLFKIH
jgi:hypothetical protein